MLNKLSYKRLFFVIACILCISFWSCRRDVEPGPDLGYGYFPLEVGQWAIYDVEDIIYVNADPQNWDTAVYQLKEIVESSFIDNQGRTAYRMERYKRDHPDSSWAITDAWTMNIDAYTAERVEENIRYIKLAFPIRSNQFWDGNALNNLVEWEYSYDQIDEQKTINNNAFDSTVTVQQRDYHILIDYEQAQEIYAKNVGLIYKRLKDVEIENFDTLQIDEGIQYTQTLVSYGN
jgi:hypothetical protein